MTIQDALSANYGDWNERERDSVTPEPSELINEMQDDSSSSSSSSSLTHISFTAPQQVKNSIAKRKQISENVQNKKGCQKSWAEEAGRIAVVERRLMEQEHLGQVSYSDYEDYAQEIREIKKGLIERLKEEFLDKEFQFKQLEGVKKLLSILHPLPLNETILAEEIAYFEKANEICQRIIDFSLKPSKTKNTAIDLLQMINNQKIPLLKYNHASLFSKMTSETIVEEYASRAADREKSSDDSEEGSSFWQKIKDHLQDSIGKFEEVRELYQAAGNHAALLECDRAIALGYEKLADIHFDQSKELPIAGKIVCLNQAKDYYLKVKSLRNRDQRDIDLSILNAFYEMAAGYKELEQQDNWLKALDDLEAHLKAHLPPKEHYRTKPEVIFYELSILAEKYTIQKEQQLVDKAKVKTDFYQKELGKVNTWFRSQIEIYNYLKHFAPLFNLEIASLHHVNEFTMSSLELGSGLVGRRQQFSEGLNKLSNQNFSEKYGIVPKEHQMAAFKKWHEHCATHTHGYFCHPTGAGKTITMILAMLAAQMPTLIIVSNTILVDQTIDEIEKIDASIQVSRFDGLAKQKFLGQVLVTTYDSLQVDSKRVHPLLHLNDFGLVLADECHRALTRNAAALIEKMKLTALVFGFTATDFYNGKRVNNAFSHAEQVFGVKIHEVDLLQLIIDGQLAAVKNVFVHSQTADSRRVNNQLDERDYTDEELIQLIDQEKESLKACEIYFNEYDPDTKRPLLGRSTIVVSFGIENANFICERLNNMNLIRRNRGENCWQSKYPLAATVHSGNPTAYNRQVIKLHKEGKIPVLVGDKAFLVGYNNPKEELGLILRPTKSVVMSKQGGGRFIRTHPGKDFATIIEWSYKGLSQVFFKDFLEGKAWAGLTIPDPEMISPQRETEGYWIQWTPEGPSRRTSPALSSRSSESTPVLSLEGEDDEFTGLEETLPININALVPPPLVRLSSLEPLPSSGPYIPLPFDLSLLDLDSLSYPVYGVNCNLGSELLFNDPSYLS